MSVGTRTVTYIRADGTEFEGPLFHPRMEMVGVNDPRDGKLKTFESMFGTEGRIVRVEVMLD